VRGRQSAQTTHMKNATRDSRAVYLTTGQAARQLGISRRTLGRAVDRAEIACARQTPGGWALFLAADVDAFDQRLSAPVTVAPHIPSPLVRQEGDSQNRDRTPAPSPRVVCGSNAPHTRQGALPHEEDGAEATGRTRIEGEHTCP